MTALFLKILNMSIAAGWCMAAVLLVRPLLHRAPRWVHLLLWALVGMRLVCPLSVRSVFSLLPSAQTVPSDIALSATPAITSGIPLVNSAVNPVLQEAFTPQAAASANPLQIILALAAALWLGGMVLLVGYAALRYGLLRRRLATALRCGEGLYQSKHIATPFVLGFLRPKIYLPPALDETAAAHVIAHERAHIARRDHLIKPLGFLLATLHWFNPMVWVCYVLLCRDIELACDARVIGPLTPAQRADYTQALLLCSAGRRAAFACPLAFGEVSVRERVKAVLQYRKPTMWLILAAVVLCALVAVCFLTDPPQQSTDLSQLNYKNAISQAAEQAELTAIHCPEGTSEIRVGAVSGHDLAQALAGWQWRACRAPRQSLPSPGSVQFLLSEEYRITVHQRKAGGLRAYAVVTLQDAVRYYSIGYDDYAAAVALLHVPTASADNTAEDFMPGTVYVYEKEGIGGAFTLTLFDNGRFSYYEGYASSYLGMGTWQRTGDLITLQDDGGYPLVHHFRAEGDDLVFVAEGSHNFLYVKVKDGERFRRSGYAEPAVPVTDGGETQDAATTWDRIPMVRVDGILYLDTGHTASGPHSDEVYDGTITTQVDSSCEPTVDDQSNFGSGYRYRRGSRDGTVEVYLAQKWRIFATEAVRRDIQFP